MKIKLGGLKALIREAVGNVASRLRPDYRVTYRNNVGLVPGCIVVSTNVETNEVTLDVPHGSSLARITIDADRIVDVKM